MIENFTLDTDANPQNMNMLIKAINDNSSAIGQKVDKEAVRELKGALANIDINTVVTPGLYHLNTSCLSTPIIGGNGFLEVTPHIKGGVTYILQDVTMWSISPYYMRRFQRVMLQGVWKDWEEFSWAKTPTETIITSSFAAGWSGVISIRKSQEGIYSLSIPALTKTAQINSALETIYTTSVKPLRDIKITTVGINPSVGIVLGSMIDVVWTIDGILRVRNVGSVSTNVREISSLQLIGI